MKAQVIHSVKYELKKTINQLKTLTMILKYSLGIEQNESRRKHSARLLTMWLDRIGILKDEQKN